MQKSCLLLFAYNPFVFDILFAFVCAYEGVSGRMCVIQSRHVLGICEIVFHADFYPSGVCYPFVISVSFKLTLSNCSHKEIVELSSASFKHSKVHCSGSLIQIS